MRIGCMSIADIEACRAPNKAEASQETLALNVQGQGHVQGHSWAGVGRGRFCVETQFASNFKQTYRKLKLCFLQ